MTRTFTACRAVILVVTTFLLFSCGSGTELKLSDLTGIQLNQDSALEIDLNPDEPTNIPYIYTIKVQPKYGTLTAGKNHRHFVYTPFRNYFGPDNFEFEATDGNRRKSAKASIAVNDIFIAGRPMTVKFLELTSPASGQLKAIWFNSFDIDGRETDLRYHIHLSTDPDFYPTESNRVNTLTGEITTTLTGLQENQTYFIAILAEDIDGKLSKRIDKQQMHLITNNLVLKNGIELVTIESQPVSSVNLTSTDLTLSLREPVQNLTGKILQLSETHEHAFIKIESSISISAAQHRYRYSYAKPGDFVQDIAISINRGSYDPLSALAEYYEDSAGQLSGNLSKATYMAATDAAASDQLDDFLNKLLNWANFESIDDLYAYLEQASTISIEQFKSSNLGCGTVAPEFEPLDPLSVRPDPLEFNLGLKFECNMAYTVRVFWNDVLRNQPELISGEFNGSISTSLNTKGRLAGSFLEKAVEIPRNRQFTITRTIQVGYIPIPITFAVNVKGTLEGEGYGELQADFKNHTVTGINYGVEYTAANGYRLLGDGLYHQNVPSENTSGSILNADWSAKLGVEIKSRVGPELILSIINAGPAYKLGFDGLATLSTHIGPALSYKIEAEQNPDEAVKYLDAPLFGIGTYEWIGSIGADAEMKLHIPIEDKWETNVEPIEIRFLHLPAYEIKYEDKALGSRQFVVSAVNNDIFQFNDADIINSQSKWHVIEPSDGTLSPFDNNKQANGTWSSSYDGNSTIIFEYLPDTLASLVDGVSEAVQLGARRYTIFMPKFLLEGDWQMTADLDFQVEPLAFAPFCLLDGPERLSATQSFRFDEAGERYFRTLSNPQGDITPGVGGFYWAISHLPNEIPEIDPYKCYPPPMPVPPQTPQTGTDVFFTGLKSKYMTSDEFKTHLLTKTNSLSGLSASELATANQILQVNFITPDDFRISVKGRSTDAFPFIYVDTYFDFRRIRRSD